MLDSTSNILFTLRDFVNPSIENAGEVVYSSNSLGAHLAAFDRNSTVRFSAENVHIHVPMLAAQMGTTVTTSATTCPCYETLTVGAGPATTATIANVPVGSTGAEIPYIWKVNSDGSLGTRFAVGATASATIFEIAAASSLLTLPVGAGLVAGDRLFVRYLFSATTNMRVEKDAANSAKEGSGELEVLLKDPCSSTRYHAYFVFPSIKLDPNFSIATSVDSNHPFSFESLADPCSSVGQQYYLVIA
jgi:hypothetical protein